MKCSQLYQRGIAQLGFKGTRNSRGVHSRDSRGAGGFGRDGRGHGRGGLGREANLVTGGPGPGEEDSGNFATSGHQLRPVMLFQWKSWMITRKKEVCVGDAGHRWCGRTWCSY